MAGDIDFECDLYDGKYTYRRYKDGRQEALRYKEPWRDLTGDGFVLAMAQEIESLKDKIEDMGYEAKEADARSEL